jgi:hypothetical protein
VQRLKPRFSCCSPSRFLQGGNRVTTQTDSKWRQRFKVHPAADLFPMLSAEELDKLTADIKANGLKLRVDVRTLARPPGGTLFEPLDIEVLDGRNRLEALELAGIEIDPDTHFNDMGFLDGAGAFLHIMSMNVHRRHLTSEQKRQAIDALLKADPSQSDRQIAKAAKAHHGTVASRRTDLEATGEISQLDERKGADGKTRKAKPERAAKETVVEPEGDIDLSIPECLDRRSQPTGEQILREARVDRLLAKQDKEQLEKNNRQVKELTVAAKAYQDALVVAAKSVPKFSPEAVAFMMEKFANISATQDELFPDQPRPNGKSAIVTIAAGIDAALRHFIMEIIALDTPSMRAKKINEVIAAVNAHARQTAERAASYETAPPKLNCLACHGKGTITSKKTGTTVACRKCGGAGIAPASSKPKARKAGCHA